MFGFPVPPKQTVIHNYPRQPGSATYQLKSSGNPHGAASFNNPANLQQPYSNARPACQPGAFMGQNAYPRGGQAMMPNTYIVHTPATNTSYGYDSTFHSGAAPSGYTGNNYNQLASNKRPQPASPVVVSKRRQTSHHVERSRSIQRRRQEEGR